MSSSDFVNNAARKVFTKHMQQYAPQDPLYETYTDNRGRTKRRRRELPPGLSPRDERILRSVKRRAHHLDKGFSLCGMRFGWAFIIGLVPGLGDVGDILLGYYLVFRKCRQADLPGWLLREMMLNIIASAAVGTIPLVGDIVVGYFKANSRNAALLEEFLRVRGEQSINLQAQGKGAPASSASVNNAQGIASTSRKQEITAGVSASDAQAVKPGVEREQGVGEPAKPAKGRNLFTRQKKAKTADAGDDGAAA